MVEVEVDGVKVEVREGSMVMDACNKLDVYVPHFCYHKKLSIAANCRMCLVQVEKAPKPLPACATPVTQGMKVWTASEQAKKAQQGVMEFLLINHPLDCPICDQGGECQLQDLAVGYGGSASRYSEEKRVVFHKNVGPLISMEEMTRCIHCTRCVRFGQEIAGVMELGMLGRGEHSEITSFVGKTVDSELSGNMIDICPVGALTSKPFRYSARTWELSRRRSVSPHDSLGANLVIQVKGDRVMRVVPQENDAVNECWISDKDRFSYEALNSPDRLTAPMVKQGGEWKEVDWPTALEFVAHGLKDVATRHGAAAIGTLVSPHATLEEMHLAQKLTRGLGSENIDFRLRQSDFSGDRSGGTAPWLGMPLADLDKLDRVLVVGSFLRKDHPLIAARLRAIARKQAHLHSIHSASSRDWLINVASESVVAPSRLVAELRSLLASLRGADAPANIATIATSLRQGRDIALFAGSHAEQTLQAGEVHRVMQEIVDALVEANPEARVRLGFFGEASNSVGGYIARATPAAGGLSAAAMLAEPRRAYLVVGAEVSLDTAHGARAVAALKSADLSVVLTPFRHSTDCADVLLPIAPFTETAGAFINCEGRAQTFNGVVKPLGETRPGWKVLRVLGNLLGLAGFDHDSTEAVRAECLPADLSARLDNRPPVPGAAAAPAVAAGFERVAEIPIYWSDPLVRRAASLALTADARPPLARLHPDDLTALGSPERVEVAAAGGVALVGVAADPGIARGCVRLPGAHPDTLSIGPLAGSLEVRAA
ncbi:MAG: NADH-quinone oxidoreductase subunit G [Burkholderiales bacterium]|nr:NADH-quinone oxidoreductase subunit G [Burkholderiales bacterium]